MARSPRYFTAETAGSRHTCTRFRGEARLQLHPNHLGTFGHASQAPGPLTANLEHPKHTTLYTGAANWATGQVRLQPVSMAASLGHDMPANTRQASSTLPWQRPHDLQS